MYNQHLKSQTLSTKKKKSHQVANSYCWKTGFGTLKGVRCILICGLNRQSKEIRIKLKYYIGVYKAK